MLDTQKLKELKELLDSGALTQAEFDAEKKKLIDMPGAIGAVEMVPTQVPTSGHMLLTMQKPDGAKLGITQDWKGTNVVVVSVIPGSIAESTGVRVGDVLKMINGEAVSSPVDAAQKLVASGEIKLDIVRVIMETHMVAAPAGVNSLSIDVVGTWKTTSETNLGWGDSGQYVMQSGATLKIARDAHGGLTAESSNVVVDVMLCCCCPCNRGETPHFKTEKPRPLEVTDADHFEVDKLWAVGTNFFTIVDKDTLKTTNQLNDWTCCWFRERIDVQACSC